MTATDRRPRGEIGTGERLTGPDVVRAVALVGVVVMNFHGFLLLQRDTRGDDAVGDLFDPWTGPLATRFAAAFVLVAGVGVTLFTRRSRHDRPAMSARRWTLVRRGLTLYGGGLLLDMVWPGTILPYYGALFVLAALLCTWRTGAVVTAGVVAAVAGAGIAWWRLERQLDGVGTGWLSSPGTGSPRGLLLDLFVNGTHPLLPWLAFFCAGIVLGRVLDRPAWRSAAAVTGGALFVAATVLSAALEVGSRAPLASTHPDDRGLLYTASALGTALLAFAVVTWFADRFPAADVVRGLAGAGAMTLTLYVAHAVVFLVVVDELGWVRSTGLDTALAFSAAFWVVAIGVGAMWHRRFGIGPLEWLYRRLGG